MSKRADLTSQLPTGFNQCRLCQGHHSYTRIRPAVLHSEDQVLVLAHWCDPGHRPTGRAAFVRGGPDHHADIQLLAESEQALATTWNKLNA